MRLNTYSPRLILAVALEPDRTDFVVWLRGGTSVFCLPRLTGREHSKEEVESILVRYTKME